MHVPAQPRWEWLGLIVERQGGEVVPGGITARAFS